MDSSPQQQANKELFQKYKDVAYLPEMKPIKILGAIDDVGDPRGPVYEIGPVIKPGKNINNRSRNHADYVNENGGYDIVCYLTDFADQFPSLNHWTVSPYSTKQVSCLIQAHTNILTYERLVIGKHHLQRTYCHVPAVYRLNMERQKNDNWEEKDNREDNRLLDIEKEIWTEIFPRHSKELESKLEEDCGDEGDGEEEVDDDDDSSSSSSGAELIHDH
ncbi:hypothetical protein ACHAW6_000012 [Cyclotella cf. meneghiniana]